MNHVEYIKKKRQELVDVAEDILHSRIDILDGIRRIDDLRVSIDDPDNPLFHPITGYCSETDYVPFGEVRSKFALEYLDRIDADMKKYLALIHEDVLECCRKIVKTYTENL